MQTASEQDTIVAIASGSGAAGIGVVRLSGSRAGTIARELTGVDAEPRQARYARFHDADGAVIDDGIVIRFAAPASFTGEDVVELQAHGNPTLLRELVSRCTSLGARMARPGEFSERAFLNGKLDLAQAEAVADLIVAGNLQAARAARRSLEGVFSERVVAMADSLLRMRVHVEAMIDFVDEPIETLGGDEVQRELLRVSAQLDALLHEAERGRKLRDGLHAVIIGPPNVGKSSLLNVLAGSERAIVTDIAGTTRDLLHETVRVGGVELNLVDTAGLREQGDVVEREGMRRARAELQRADLAIIVLDARDPQGGLAAIGPEADDVPQRIILHNKADLLQGQGGADGVLPPSADHLFVSTRDGRGLETVRQRLAELAGAGGGEGTFSARERHLLALQQAQAELAAALSAWEHQTLDLTAESLRACHDALGEITGRILPDDLLGHIFSTFCIGK